MPRNYCPRADMMLVSHDAKKLRNSLSGFLPNIGLSMVDYGRSADIDRFYVACQTHRDFYKDFTGKLRPAPGFERPERHYESRPSPTDVYVKLPLRYPIERRPVVYPLTLERTGRLAGQGVEIRLEGKYDAESCIKFKR